MTPDPFPNELVEAAASGLHDLRAHAGIRPPVSMWPPTDPDEADEYRMEARAVIAAVLPLIERRRTREIVEALRAADDGGDGYGSGDWAAVLIERTFLSPDNPEGNA